MLGPPEFPDSPVPTWEEFREDYSDSFFTPAGDGYGRVFIIAAEGRDIGCISYDGLQDWHGTAELDLWIASASDWGRGWGGAAIRQLSEFLLGYAAVSALLIRPSARNARAIAAYRRAGFEPYDPQRHPVSESDAQAGLDYEDAVVLVKTRDRAAE
jgi:diamine N-acetyltransferase